MPNTPTEVYFPVLLQILIAMVVAAGMLGASFVLGKRVRNRVKDLPYECGITPVGDARQRFSVKFYLVAMLFILFDIEVVFMYPWAVVYRDMLKDPVTRNMILGSMISFLGILFIGYIYALKKHAFDWKKS